MRTLNAAVVLVTTLALTGGRAPDVVRYDIDRGHSTIGFSVKHLLVTTARGAFNDFEGTIMLDEEDITRSAVNVTIQASSIDTNHPRRDADLRSESFFDVANHPTITFVGRSVEQQGEKLVLNGDLTMRGVTKRVQIPFALNGPIAGRGGQKVIGVEGAVTIDRFDYGLRWNDFTEGVQVVSNEVKIELNLQARTPRN